MGNWGRSVCVFVAVLAAAACSTSADHATSGARGQTPAVGGADDGNSGEGGARGGELGLAGASGGSDAASAGEAGNAGIGNSAGDDSGPSLDPARSLATVFFPPAVSYTDASSITVRGSAQDRDGVASVSVNGVPVVTKDDFSSWTVTLPVVDGEHSFAVSVTDQIGNTSKNVASFILKNHGTSAVEVNAMDFDAETQSLIITDHALYAILKLDLATNRISIVSDQDHGAGDPFMGSESVVVDSAKRRALSFNWTSDVLLAVDLSTGDRTVVSAPPGVQETSVSIASGLALDADYQRVFVASQQSIIEINLVSGIRRVVSSATVGSGVPVQGMVDIAYDGSAVTGPRLLVSDPSSSAILAIDPTSGARSVLSSAAVGVGPALAAPGRMKLDLKAKRLLVVDGIPFRSGSGNRVNRAALVSIDLDTGNRTDLVGPAIGEGFFVDTPHALALDAETGQAYVARDSGGQIAEVGLASLKRRELGGADVGAGEKLFDPGGIALGAGILSGQLLTTDALLANLVEVDRATGDRTVLSGHSAGSGPGFVFPVDVVLQPGSSGANALVLDAGLQALLAVNLGTGDRTVLSSPDVGAGPVFSDSGQLSLQAMAVDTARGRVLVTNYQTNALGAVIAIDLATGDRTLISSPSRGVGEALLQPNGIVLDDSPGSGEPSAFLANYDRILRVNLTTGDRSVFSSYEAPAQASGSPMIVPRRAVLDPLSRSLLVTDISGFIIAVDATNGNRTLVSGRNLIPGGTGYVGAGPGFSSAGGISGDFAEGLLYVADPRRAAIMAIDLVSAERVLLSH